MPRERDRGGFRQSNPPQRHAHAPLIGPDVQLQPVQAGAGQLGQHSVHISNSASLAEDVAAFPPDEVAGRQRAFLSG